MMLTNNYVKKKIITLSGSGCPWDPEAPMFQQQEEEGEVLAWNYYVTMICSITGAGLELYPRADTDGRFRLIE